MKRSARYMAIFTAGLLAAISLHYFVTEHRPAQPAASAPNIVVVGFLFDGVRSQDLPRMSPPGSLPGLVPAPPVSILPPVPPPSDLRK
jgi:hypothetical protein